MNKIIAKMIFCGLSPSDSIASFCASYIYAACEKTSIVLYRQNSNRVNRFIIKSYLHVLINFICRHCPCPTKKINKSCFPPPIQNKRRSHTRNLSFRPRPSHCLSNVRISSWYSPALCVYMIQTLLPSVQYHHSYWGMTVLKQRGCVCSCTHPRTFTAPLCSLRRH